VAVPPHLYGELAKTAKGSGILKQSAHHLELLSVLRDVSQPPLARRTAMWALVRFLLLPPLLSCPVRRCLIRQRRLPLRVTLRRQSLA
jgi:hypothetical protein